MDLSLFQVHVGSHDINVCVSMRPKEGVAVRATSEACIFGPKPGYWYLNRALVEPPTARGQGFGTYVMKRLLDTLAQRSDFEALIVEPGGYTNQIGKQRRFYRRLGFVRSPKFGPNVYVWKPERTSSEVGKTT